MSRCFKASIGAIALLAAGHASALTNGYFESGTLNGWYSQGYFGFGSAPGGTTAVLNASSGYTPISGNYSALIVAVSGQPVNASHTCAQDIWNANCPLPAAFTPSAAPLPTYISQDIAVPFMRGGFIAQDITVAAGDTLHWATQRLGEVAGSAPGVDLAYFVASNGVTTQRVDLRTATDSFVFTQGGLWSIYFGVGQTEDPFQWSALKVDAIALEPAFAATVPEPASWSMMAVALAGLAVFGRKRLR